MRNFFLATALLATASFSARAGQLLGVSLQGAPTTTVLATPRQATLELTVAITNTTGRTLTLGLQRQIRSAITGSENNFCFGPNCYPATVTTSATASPVVLANGGTDRTMVLDYTPNSKPGITTVRYAVFEQGTTDSTYITVRFDASNVLASTAAHAAESLLSSPWPNPTAAGSTTELSYQLPAGSGAAELVLVSLADGRRVRSLAVPFALMAGRIQLSTENLAPGFYTCLLLGGSDGRQLLAARRLQIQ
ncbi:MAG: hypothetical protein ACRYFX_20220 [Janthinobacterium lividum]